eukprot:5624643-Ditylum_brightwellii.AAC.1
MGGLAFPIFLNLPSIVMLGGVGRIFHTTPITILASVPVTEVIFAAIVAVRSWIDPTCVKTDS